MEVLVKYGERIVCHVKDDNGAEVPVTVIEYIRLDLEQDNLQFHDPMHRSMLHEAEYHLRDLGFSPARYFLSHPSTVVSRMAADILDERHLLSKSNEQTIVKDEERLHELVPRLLVEFKISVLEEEMQQFMQQLSLPEVSKDAGRVMEIMTRYKQSADAMKELARRAGERVFVKV